MEQPVITFALAKGRLAEQAFDLLEQLGIDCSEPRNPGRQLVLWDLSLIHISEPTRRS